MPYDYTDWREVTPDDLPTITVYASSNRARSIGFRSKEE